MSSLSGYSGRSDGKTTELLRLTRTRGGVLAALTAAVLIAATLGTAAPANAALSGSDWVMQPLAQRYTDGITGGPSISPVSCVPGQKFCVAIVGDTGTIVNGFYIGQSALVTTDKGQTWTAYATLPAAVRVDAISCASDEVCWVAGTEWSDGAPAVAETTDGGQQWTDMTPGSWASASWWPNAIDCVSATTCWLAGTAGYGYSPSAAETTDGGATWTVFSNLPTFVSPDPNGTYTLQGISCQSADACVAVGGLDEADGTATVITTDDGGVTWSRSASAALSRIQSLVGVSCLPHAGSVTCYGAGSGTGASGSVVLVSHDDGVTWTRKLQPANNGWLSSISCVSARNCWAAGAGTTDALVGTSDRGTSWSTVTSDTSNEYGSVSCLSRKICVAVTDGGLWVTSDDGGLATG
jgi:hypothetical protein